LEQVKTKKNVKSINYFVYLGNGRLLTAFTDQTFKTNIFEELTLPIDMRYSIKSIAYQKVYVILLNQ